MLLQRRLRPAARLPLPELLEALVNVGQAIGKVVARRRCRRLGRKLLDRCKGPAEHPQIDAATLHAMNPVGEAEARAGARERGAEPGWRRW